MTPLRSASLAQVAGAIIAVVAIQLFNSKLFLQPVLVGILQGICAAAISHKLSAPNWWTLIHLTFVPALLIFNQLDIPPWIWLSAFLVLFLVFWRTDKSRVPLYLTNAKTADTIATLLPSEPCHCVDLGCGTASLLQRLAKTRPDCSFVGIEHAPVPFLIAWLRSQKLDNLSIRRGDFWLTDFSQYQVVYAFLSPIPMPRLWQKSRSEMPFNSLLISNSFPIPDVLADKIVAVSDRRQTQLYCYRPSPNEKPN